LFRTAFTDGELRCAIAKLLNVGGLHQHTLGPDADRAGKKVADALQPTSQKAFGVPQQ
jgi:hypothetical protein